MHPSQFKLVFRSLCSTTCTAYCSNQDQLQSQGDSSEYRREHLSNFIIKNHLLYLKDTCGSYIRWYLQIGNPLLEFNTDFNARSEYFWSHGLISDSTLEILTKVCNYSSIRRQRQNGNLEEVCAKASKQLYDEVSDYVDEYDVTLDVCLSSVNQQAYVLNQLVSFFYFLHTHLICPFDFSPQSCYSPDLFA